MHRKEPLFGGVFGIYQAEKGLRFSLDSVILGAFPFLRKGEKVLDFGCGSGILLLLLAGREGTLRLAGIDRNPDLIALAKENLSNNGLSGEILCGDAMNAATLFPEGCFDLIISNPPYYPVGSCRLPRDSAIAAARTELYWNQQKMLEQAFLLLQPNGSFTLSFDYARKEELLSLAGETGFFPARILDLQTKSKKTSKRFLVELKKIPVELRQETLLLYDESGAETPELKRILKVYDRTGTVSGGNAHRQS